MESKKVNCKMLGWQSQKSRWGVKHREYSKYNKVKKNLLPMETQAYLFLAIEENKC